MINRVPQTLKSLLQHHSSKALIFQCLAFLTVQLSHPYLTTGKTIAFTRRTFVGKVMSLLFNMLSRLIITFLPRSKRLLISWLQSQSAVILEPPKIKSDTVSTVSPSIFYEVMGPDAMILVFWMFSFKPTFSLSYFTFIKKLFGSSSLYPIRCCLPLKRQNVQNIHVCMSLHRDLETETFLKLGRRPGDLTGQGKTSILSVRKHICSPQFILRCFSLNHLPFFTFIP